ncbi:hypothetical protein HYPBUDRAFT_159308 [Hyphopichia burtonii NRRL Y-1933]|uniref:Mediator of RNA polymerase II transcription subunit 22 n=1 Tax=Hyphopichia burtonii NRRL Y-1933 TaxID=984485 RepID=A0A1E4RQ86_9ASCO|nr:hypothetical protein HYPBUDRAFT_159308 [Hyphopichia burtonii NRRL Y-1933]ODV69398.1 hypothetical protein HYPBUDRAFT_159308 [Hyphopichia burtonii NRRL Y-1933]
MQPRSIALLQRIDTNVEQILQKFEDIFEVAIIQDKSREQLSVENLTIESDSALIIRLCEDLLSITRDLKEAWCLGTLKVTRNADEDKSEEEVRAVFDKFNELTERIAGFKDIKKVESI